MDRHLMVKQRLGEIPANKTHPRLEVFTSGRARLVCFRSHGRSRYFRDNSLPGEGE